MYCFSSLYELLRLISLIDNARVKLYLSSYFSKEIKESSLFKDTDKL